MNCDAWNFHRASDKNGGPLSEKDFLGGPYWEIRLFSFGMMDSADFGDVLYMRGIYKNVLATRIHSLLLQVKKSAAWSCQGESGTSLRSIG